MMASTLLPSPQCGHLDRPIAEVDLTEVGYLKKDGEMAIKLNEFDIDYHPQQATKAEVLTNFLIKYIIPKEEPTMG